ncbi:MerR family transcriptional regulator [Acidobacterium sp. S8]|uniref:MerR family transcriptional regulator n=1 Tax=Acidobacterium sp. S8 TaxID=1641854 RepID=UPI00131AA749|nr:MerR family transcriptional regulator [Acidobacterium sp. S8]
MFKIGEFSALTRISIKTLRYYDETGLLRPAHVDSATGYRYYSAQQLPRLHRILALKDLGFSLDQIGMALQSTITLQELRGMVTLRRTEQENHVREEQERLARLETLIKFMEQESKMSADIVIKEVGPEWIVSVRETIANYPSVGALYPEVINQTGGTCAAGMPVAIWHDMEHKEKDVDAEAGFFIKEALPSHGTARMYQLDGATVASYMHHGAFNRLDEAYQNVMRWVEANHYRVAGPFRELYHYCTQPVRQDDDSYVTEIQVPVAKTA